MHPYRLFAHDGLGNFNLSLIAGYRFVESVGVYLRPTLHGFFPERTFVAEGTVDLFWQFGLRAWDVAAGLVLANEAGADFRVLNEGTDWLAGGPIDLVVAAPSLLDEALAVGLPLLTSND